MHACEGRPLFIVISGKVKIIDEEEFDELSRVLDDIYERLMAVMTANKAKTIFRDETGCAYEMPYRLVSVASSCYLLLGRGNPIPIIFVVQDLLYPFRNSETIQEEIDKATRFLKNLVERALTDEYKNKIDLDIIDTRWLDTPFSLVDIPRLARF